MPLTLKGSCHCKQVEFELESNTPVPYMICQCSICRKVGGYMGSSNIMGNTDTLKITKGKDKIKEYRAVLEFGKDGTPKKRTKGVRSFCSECSSMLWNYDEEWAHWIYPFASVIDSPHPLPGIPGYPQFTMSPTTPTAGARMGMPDEADKPELYVLMRDSCPAHVPVPCNAAVYGSYTPGEGIEAWHKATGTWVD